MRRRSKKKIKAEAKRNAAKAEKAAKEAKKATVASAIEDALDEEATGKRIRRALAIKAIQSQVPLTKLPGLVENGFDAKNLYQSLNRIGRGDFDEVLKENKDLYNGSTISELIAETKDRLRTSSPIPDIGEIMSKTLANRRKAYARNLTLKEKLYGDPQYGAMAELAAGGYLDPPEDVYPTLKSIKESNADLRFQISKKKKDEKNEREERRAYERQTKDESSVIAEQERQRKEDERRQKELREAAAKNAIAHGATYEEAEKIRQGIIPVPEDETVESFNLDTEKKKDEERARAEQESRERERREAYARRRKAAGASREEVEWILQGHGSIPSDLSTEDLNLQTARILDQKDADKEREKEQERQRKEEERKRREEEAAQEQQARDEDFDYIQQQKELQEKREIYAKQADVDNRLLGGEGITNLQRQSILNGWDSRVDDVLKGTDKDDMIEMLARAQDRLGVKQDKEREEKSNSQELKQIIKLLTGIRLNDKQVAGIIKKFNIKDIGGLTSQFGLALRAAGLAYGYIMKWAEANDTRAKIIGSQNAPALAADRLNLNREDINREVIAGGQYGIKADEVLKNYAGIRNIMDALFRGDSSGLVGLAIEGLDLDPSLSPIENMNRVEEFLNRDDVLDENKRNIISKLGLTPEYVKFRKDRGTARIASVRPEQLESRAIANEQESEKDKYLKEVESRYDRDVESIWKSDLPWFVKMIQHGHRWIYKQRKSDNPEGAIKQIEKAGLTVDQFNLLPEDVQDNVKLFGDMYPKIYELKSTVRKDFGLGDDRPNSHVTNVGGVTQVFNGRAEPEKVKEATESAIRNAGASMRTSSTSHEIGGRQQ